MQNISDIDPTTLNIAERESYNALLQQVMNHELTLNDFKNYVIKMKDAICLELAELPNWDSEKNTNLKARLKVYITMIAFLETPEKAKAAFDRAVANIKISDKPKM